MDISSVITDATASNPTGGSVNLTVAGGTAPYDFQWSNGNNVEDLLNAAGGTYNVTVTDASGLEAFLTVTVAGPPVSVADQTPVPFNLTIFPNPARETLQVDIYGTNSLKEINITNAFGQVVRTVAVNGRNKINIDIRDLASGTYFVVANKAGAAINKKFVVVE